MVLTGPVWKLESAGRCKKTLFNWVWNLHSNLANRDQHFSSPKIYLKWKKKLKKVGKKYLLHDFELKQSNKEKGNTVLNPKLDESNAKGVVWHKCKLQSTHFFVFAGFQRSQLPLCTLFSFLLVVNFVASHKQSWRGDKWWQKIVCTIFSQCGKKFFCCMLYRGARRDRWRRLEVFLKVLSVNFFQGWVGSFKVSTLYKVYLGWNFLGRKSCLFHYFLHFFCRKCLDEKKLVWNKWSAKI